jgi:hypothetical protein
MVAPLLTEDHIVEIVDVEEVDSSRLVKPVVHEIPRSGLRSDPVGFEFHLIDREGNTRLWTLSLKPTL